MLRICQAALAKRSAHVYHPSRGVARCPNADTIRDRPSGTGRMTMPAREESTITATWRRAILEYIAQHPDRPIKTRALARELHVPNEDYTTFRTLVRTLLAEGSLLLGSGRTLRLPARASRVIGVFRASSRGLGFLERPGKRDLLIPRQYTCGAREGDTVAVRLLRGRARDTGPRAEVVRIVERAPVHWVGTLERKRDHWTVRPHGSDRLPAVTVDPKEAQGSRPGDLVVVEPDGETLRSRHVRGTIVERLGDPRDAQARIRGVVRRFALPDAFPPEVERAAVEAVDRFDPERVSGRTDLRDLPTVTIDPVDARDFDDAISIRRMAGNRWQLGVHIADVAWFVEPGGPIDREAQRRGLSLYFPGQVVPMLPEPLSNDVCSLQPGKPRLTKSALITYDQAGNVIDTNFINSMIRSRARLTYEQTDAVLAGDAPRAARGVVTLLKQAGRLARLVLRRRLKEGMISLTLPEIQITLDETGRVEDAHPADAGFSHRVIEMFMVEANEAVSRALTRRGLEHLRRIHPEPEVDSAETLAGLTPLLGIPAPKAIDRASIRAILDAAQGRPEEPAVHYVLLRSMERAFYGTDRAAGHFALASAEYCHFTSPIRRYPDLTVHRQLERLIREDTKNKTESELFEREEWADLGRRMSTAERRALQAERKARDILLLLLMEARPRTVLEGMITGVMSVGAFVQVRPFLAEGLIRVADFGADEWLFDRRRGVYAGRRTGRVVHMGQTVRVRIAEVDVDREELTLVPADASRLGVVSTVPRRKQAVRRSRRPRRR